MWPFSKLKNQRRWAKPPVVATTSKTEIPNKSTYQINETILSAEKVLEVYEDSQGLLTPDIERALESPQERQRLYKLLLGRPVTLYSTLIRQAFAKEIGYRDALWHGTVEDDGDCYEGIYRCAFLIYRIGSLDDIHVLWSAKYMNMDVGSSMGAEFFIGAGLKATRSYLEESNLPESNEILDYIADWFSHNDAEKWHVNWEADMVSNIARAGD